MTVILVILFAVTGIILRFLQSKPVFSIQAKPLEIKCYNDDEEAKRQLTQTDHPITEIAMMLG